MVCYCHCLLEKLHRTEIIGLLYIQWEILPILGNLSKTFQQNYINVSHIVPEISNAKAKLLKVAEDKIQLKKLSGTDSLTKLSDEIKINKDLSSQLEKTMSPDLIQVHNVWLPTWCKYLCN